MATTHSVPSWNRGDRLRKAREAAGIRSGAMAELMGVDPHTITRWEKNKAMTRASIHMWAELTGTPSEWLESGIYLPSEHSGGSRRRPHGLASIRRYPLHNHQADKGVCVT